MDCHASLAGLAQNLRAQPRAGVSHTRAGSGAKEQVMKIGNTAATSGIAPVANATTASPDTVGNTKAGKGSPGAAATGNASATVKLSSTAADLLGGAVDGTFDQAKVEQVKQSIADGSYKVNPEAIADKLIANAQELLSRTGSSPSSQG
jgi:negative regulator of flagellin synthesis FlgM